jgi:hypothetical protein
VLRLFRNYSPFTVLILIIAAFLAKLQPLLHPVAPRALPDHLVFDWILRALNYVFFGNAFAYTLFSVVILISQALFLNYITVRHKMFSRNSYLPAFTYLLLTSLNPSFNYFSEPLLINGLTLIAVNIMLSFSQTSQPRKQIFNAGFAICLPVLLQFPAVGFVLLFLLALVFLRSFNPGEWVVGLMGYLTPIYFFAGILFLVDRFDALPRVFRIGFSVPRHLTHPVYLIGTILGLGILAIIGSVSIQQQISRMTIYIRRAWGLAYTYLAISLGVAFITVSAVAAEWLIMMPALSLIISQSFCFEKSKRFSSFTFYFSLLLLIFCQLALNK